MRFDPIACCGDFMRSVVLAVIALSLASAAAHAERRVALVLGNSNYQHAPALANPVRDAQAIADQLKGLDFEVVSGFDLTKGQTQETVAKFAKQVRGADIALFYYAGLALQVSGNNYLLPVDAAMEDETSLDFEAVPLDFILRQMSRETSVRLVFLDASRDNPLADVLAKSGGVKVSNNGLAQIQIENGGAGALLAFAASPDQVADADLGEHSLFSAALLAHIGEPNIPITEAMNRVSSDVIKATAGRQRPWISVLLSRDIILHKVDADQPLIVGEVQTPPADSGSEQHSAASQANPPDNGGQAALDKLQQEIPKLASDRPVFFDIPVNFGDPAIDGQSIAQLIQGKPHFSPVQGLDKSFWDKQCSGCHQWTKERLCEQAKNYMTNSPYVLRLQHPLGTRFKVALGMWAKNGCQ